MLSQKKTISDFLEFFNIEKNVKLMAQTISEMWRALFGDFFLNNELNQQYFWLLKTFFEILVKEKKKFPLKMTKPLNSLLQSKYRSRLKPPSTYEFTK